MECPVRIYSREKTLADTFKYRHKIGLDVAIEGTARLSHAAEARLAAGARIRQGLPCRKRHAPLPGGGDVKPLKNVAASVHQRLLNIARQSDRPFNELAQYYALERWLYRPCPVGVPRPVRAERRFDAARLEAAG